MTTRTRTPWQMMVGVLVAGGIMGAGTGAVINARHPDGVSVTSNVPAPVSGEDGAPR